MWEGGGEGSGDVSSMEGKPMLWNMAYLLLYGKYNMVMALTFDIYCNRHPIHSAKEKRKEISLKMQAYYSKNANQKFLLFNCRTVFNFSFRITHFLLLTLFVLCDHVIRLALSIDMKILLYL